MIQVNGYKAMKGRISIISNNIGYSPFIVEGDCIYRPDTDCWYVQTLRGLLESYPADICEVEKDDSEVKRGRWKETECDVSSTVSYYCSACGLVGAISKKGFSTISPIMFGRQIYKYCPHCGAIMDL